jgi:hypothetical protein
MYLQKLTNKINNFFNKNKKKRSDNKLYSKDKINSKLLLRDKKGKSLIKKRRCFSIKSSHLENIKIFLNKISSYYIFIFIFLLIIIIYIIF